MKYQSKNLSKACQINWYFQIMAYLNSVSYEEILFVSINVFELIFPVVDGKIVEDEEASLSGSSVALLEGTNTSAYSLPIESGEG